MLELVNSIMILSLSVFEPKRVGISTIGDIPTATIDPPESIPSRRMGEAVGCVTKAMELAVKIKDAVDMVRQNRKDCAHIKRRVERVGHTLSLCKDNAELMGSPAVRAAVEALAEVLGEALELVTGCQEETNTVCLYCTAGKVSKQLGKVDRGISDGNSEATFAILVFHISRQTQHVRTCYARRNRGEIIPHPLVGDEMALEQAPESGLSPDQRQDVSSSPEDRYYCGEFEDRHVKNGALLHKIASVALRIRTATETVRRNRDECVQIDKLASRIILILSQLEHTETKKDTAVRLALKSLRKTFHKAHKLVAACQRLSVVVLCSPGKLSGELRGVLDEMILGLDDLIDALL